MNGDKEILYEKFKLIAELAVDRWERMTISEVRELKHLAQTTLELVERRRKGDRRG